MPSTHSQKLERWLTPEEVEATSRSMKDWYGPPIALGNVPGAVYACGGGDFRGHIEAGSEASLWEMTYDKARRIEANLSRRFGRWLEGQVRGDKLDTGFAGISDFVEKAAQGKQVFFFRRAMNNTIQNNCATSFYSQSSVGVPIGNNVAPGSAPGGTVNTSADPLGTWKLVNPGGTKTMHFAGGDVWTNIAPAQLLLCDRIFSVRKAPSSSAAEAVTGVPTRYQNTTHSAVDSAQGNFLFPEVITNIANVSHTWTTCLYTDESGNTNQTLPQIVGHPALTTGGVNLPIGQWFAPLSAGDSGVRDIDQIQCNVATVTGEVAFVIGHPIALFPCIQTNRINQVRAIQGAFQLERIFDDACLAFLEINRPSTTGVNFGGSFKVVSG